MLPLQIKSTFILLGIQFQEIADQVGCDRSLVGHVVYRRRKNEAVRRAIAKALGLPYKEVWNEQPKKSTRGR